MGRKITVKGSPIAILLSRLQSQAGWGELVSDDLRRRVVQRLAEIVTTNSEDISPANQVAAASCLLRASQVEIESIKTVLSMLETQEVMERLERIESSIAKSQQLADDITIQIPESD